MRLGKRKGKHMPDGTKVAEEEVGVEAFGVPWVSGTNNDGEWCIALKGERYAGKSLVIAHVPCKQFADYIVVLQALALEAAKQGREHAEQKAAETASESGNASETASGEQTPLQAAPVVHGESGVSSPWPRPQRDGYLH